MTFAGFLVRFRPKAISDPRFLKYAIRSKGVQEQIHAQAVTSTIQNFNAERYANLELPDASAGEQRRIADFLDDRVSQIDRIIAARREQAKLVRHRFASELEMALLEMSEWVRASRVLRVFPGYAFASNAYSTASSDIRLLRGVNVSVGVLRWDDVVQWPASDAADVAQFRLNAGDVVLGMDRPWIGGGLRIARLKPHDGRPLLLQRVAKLIPGNNIDSRFMMRAYQSQMFRDQIESDLTGLSVPHLSGDQILSFRMPYGKLSAQIDLADKMDREDERVRGSVVQLEDSIALLTEYKTSLITAAVTGELDVTTAGSSIPG